MKVADTYTAVVVEYQGVRESGLTILEAVHRNLNNYESLLLSINRSVQVSHTFNFFTFITLNKNF